MLVAHCAAEKQDCVAAELAPLGMGKVAISARLQKLSKNQLA